MTTQEMLHYMKGEGFSMAQLACSSGVQYDKVVRHYHHGKNLSDDEKAALFKVAMQWSPLAEHIHSIALEQN